MLERTLVGHCAPTLANLKTANLFGYRTEGAQPLQEQLSQVRSQLLPRGVELRLLEHRSGRALIYVYRIRRLCRDLADPEIRLFLRECGYRDFSVAGALDHLARRIAEQGGDFPHEIGLFLGYPLGDVKGFIEHRGQNCLCTGCWKVYCDEREARKQFCRFEKCRSVYCRLYREGQALSRLTVAA